MIDTVYHAVVETGFADEGATIVDVGNYLGKMTLNLFFRKVGDLLGGFKTLQSCIDHDELVDIFDMTGCCSEILLHVLHGSASLVAEGADSENVLGCDFSFVKVFLNHLRHIGTIDGADDTDDIVFDGVLVCFYKLRDGEKFSAELFGNVKTVAGGCEVEDFHVILI